MSRVGWKLPAAILLFALLVSGVALAQNTQIQGLITGRSGATMTVKTQNGEPMVVVLSPGTQVQEVEGRLKFRKKELGLTALVPGLPVQVQGMINENNQLVANTVKFKSSDLATAQDIQAGLQPTKQQLAADEQKIAANQAATAANQQQIQEEQAKIAANKAAIAAANKRFGELGEYNILGEVTVFFANGKTAVDPQYDSQLVALATKAKTITAYIIQVQGYASKVGSAALNQKLSMERADNVLSFLEQQGQIPLTNVLAPGAMGTSQQVASDATTEGQAENRRVVVRILQNKGIAGT
jgi:OmpA-OmpF porin, OOP family